jgi:hypothetical protein
MIRFCKESPSTITISGKPDYFAAPHCDSKSVPWEFFTDDYLQHYAISLRAGDALHLAIAGNHGAETIYSLDKSMIKAGKMLGLPMSAGIRAD